MKLKSLCLGIMLMACSVIPISAQTLLISEDFSSETWKTELKRLNSTYDTPKYNKSFYGVQSTTPYFGKYYLNGAMIICKGDTVGNITNLCALFSTTGIIHSDGHVAVGFRFRSGTTAPVETTYMEFPIIPSAGTMTVHVRNGATDAATTLTLQKYAAGAWTPVKEWSLAKGSNYQGTYLDETKSQAINSKDPIKLRLVGGTKFIMMFRVDIEVYNKNNLQTAIDAATNLKNTNTGNIGTEVGKYSQVSFNTLTTAINTATTLYNLATAKSLDVDNGIIALNNAITTFKASINKTDLQTLINTATTLQTSNLSNIGTEIGQFPQANYDALVAAIPIASVINDNPTPTSLEVISAYNALKTIVNAFKASGVPVVVSNVILQSMHHSELALTSQSNISILNGGLLIIDETTEVNNITIEKGGKLTNTSELTVANIYLLSNASGTGTYVDKGTTHITGTATVQQFLHGGAGTSQRSWWYISSPVTNATSTVFDVANVTPPLNKLWYYNEQNDPNPAYVNIAANGTLLNPGTGYVLSLAGNDNTYSFTGSNLNTGDITITPTRTGTSAVKRGFNLIGNPYPSYLDWNAIDTTYIKSTMWYRTYTSGKQMEFDTFDGEDGTGHGINGLVNQFIPPMQAFWVKVKSDGLSGPIVLNNDMRYHKDVENNVLKSRALSTTKKVLRLKVSNGINGDEALIVTNPNASDGLDGLDSPKMSNDNVAIPEIFTLAGTEEIVINKLKEITPDKEMVLGFRTGEFNNFTLSATQLTNFDADTKIVLKDNLLNTEQDLTNGASYSFTSDAETTTARFSIVFKSTSITTGLNNKDNKDAVVIFKNANNQIVVNQDAILGREGKVTICNSVGQKLMITETKGSSTIINRHFPSGIYMVTVSAGGKNTTKKVIIN